MPSSSAPSASETRRSHLLARLPSRRVTAFLKKLESFGLRLDSSQSDEPLLMDSSAPGESVLMAWVLGAPEGFKQMRRDGAVLGLPEGEPYVAPPPQGVARRAAAGATAAASAHKASRRQPGKKKASV